MKKKIILILLAVVLSFSAFSGCKTKNKTIYNNETDPVVFSSGDLDGVFNPFFATSGADMNVIGLTQLGMMTSDESGGIICGEDYATVALDYKETVTGEPDASDKNNYENYYTTCDILIKNGLKFSDGSDLTIKDVLFNLYIYLDPVYTGSSTVYSTNIKGLQAYRFQTLDENQYKEAEAGFQFDADARMTSIQLWCGDYPLEEEQEAQVEADIEIVKKLFKEELYRDWSMASGLVEEYNRDYTEITETWQVFLAMYGYIELESEAGKEKKVKDWLGMENFGTGKSDEDAKEACVNYIYQDMITLLEERADKEYFKNSIYDIVTIYATAKTAREYFVADEMSKYFDEIREKFKDQEGLAVPSVSGITVKRVTSFHSKPLNETHYQLSIVVNGVDPKAKYNFSFQVSPMKYYTTTALYEEAMQDLKNNPDNPANNHFGVLCGSRDFMFDVVRDGQDVPIGAGPYKATSVNNATGMVTKNQFFDKNVVYYMRNDHFIWPAKIKLLRFKVIASAQMFNAVSEGEVHYSEPNAQASTIAKVVAAKHLDFKSVNYLGYGYIGINAAYVKDINVRKAIMHAMNTSLTVSDYYTGDLAVPIHRPMSTESWAYPQGAEPEYPFDSTGAASWNWIKDTYVKNKDGILWNGTKGSELKYTFTIAGDTTDHPVYHVFTTAKIILEKLGFKITVIQDSNALKKLASGLLTVWAAAWGSTSDPDMFQVYHKDSTATSVLNWGYKEIFDDSSRKAEQLLVNQLSEKIEEGRRVLTQSARKPIYSEALDLVMKLAIELPTYQRKNLYVFNETVIDKTTMNQDISAFAGLVDKIWELSLVTK